MGMVMSGRGIRSIRGSKMDSFVKDWARWSQAERYTAIAVIVATVVGVASHFLLEVI